MKDVELVHVPATNLTKAALVQVHKTISEDRFAVYNSEGLAFLGHVIRGSYTYSPRAAGHRGRIVRYNKNVSEWQALSKNKDNYRGGIFPKGSRKNTRKAALAFLLAAHAGAKDASYFTWAA